MRIFRNMVGVVGGYLLFAVGAIALFQIGHIDPHAAAETGTAAIVIIVGIVIAFVSGIVSKIIAPAGSLAANYGLFFVISSFATFSLARSSGSHYTQIAAIFLFGPASLAGGLLKQKIER